jgi:anti-anti-sigma regulatory factor
MLTALTVTDLDHDVIVIRLSGTLSTETVPIVRRSLLKSFADDSQAVVVDLADLRALSPIDLTVFPSAVRVHGDPTGGVAAVRGIA